MLPPAIMSRFSKTDLSSVIPMRPVTIFMMGISTGVRYCSTKKAARAATWYTATLTTVRLRPLDVIGICCFIEASMPDIKSQMVNAITVSSTALAGANTAIADSAIVLRN